MLPNAELPYEQSTDVESLRPASFTGESTFVPDDDIAVRREEMERQNYGCVKPEGRHELYGISVLLIL